LSVPDYQTLIGAMPPRDSRRRACVRCGPFHENESSGTQSWAWPMTLFFRRARSARARCKRSRSASLSTLVVVHGGETTSKIRSSGGCRRFSRFGAPVGRLRPLVWSGTCSGQSCRGGRRPSAPVDHNAAQHVVAEGVGTLPAREPRLVCRRSEADPLLVVTVR
jgi:hypothetical protein